MSDNRGNRAELGYSELRVLLGRISALMGIALAVLGALAAEISMEALGIIFGVASYTLGSRRLGLATVVFSTVMLMLVLAVSRGYFPGVEPTYPRGLF